MSKSDPGAFNNGHLDYTANHVESLEESMMDVKISSWILGTWDDGYIAFSNTERRLAAVIHDLPSMLLIPDQRVAGDQGYWMEIALWRPATRLRELAQESGGWQGFQPSINEELVLEREDDGFYMQYWKLDRDPGRADHNCCFRDIRVFPRAARKALAEEGPFFAEGELGATEVILLDKRLHFFLSRRLR